MARQNTFKTVQMTDRQRCVLDHIALCIRQDGWAPSVTDLSEEFNISRAGVLGHLHALEKKGWIKRGVGARQIKVLK